MSNRYSARFTPPGPRAHFSVVEDDDGRLVIRDESGPKSVTNDAERIVEFLHQWGILAGRRLFYYDSEGDLDELLYDLETGKFRAFAPGQRC